MRLIVGLLKFINVLLGGVVVVGGIAAYFIIERPIPLFLALGLVAVGPVESLLMKLTGQQGGQPGRGREFIDQATSLVLVFFLLAASLTAILR